MPKTLVKETLKVAVVTTKFGDGAIGVSTGEKQENGKDKLEFLSFNRGVNVPVTDLSMGETYEFELSISDTGKRYVNKVLSLGDVGQAEPKIAVPKPKMFKRLVVDNGGKPTEAYWAAKDKSMQMGGLFHDAATITASLINEQTITDNAVRIFENVIKRLVDVRKKFD